MKNKANTQERDKQCWKEDGSRSINFEYDEQGRHHLENVKSEQSPKEVMKGVLYLYLMGVEENCRQNYNPCKGPEAPVCQAPLTQSEVIGMPKQCEEVNKTW